MDFDDTAFCAVASYLPIFNCRLFAAKGSHPTHPKNAAAEMGLGGQVVKQERGFACGRPDIEIIVHDHEHVHIVGLRF